MVLNSFLNVQNNGSTGSHASVTITSGSGGFAGLHFGDSDNGRIGQVAYNNSDNSLLFTANNSERMRIDSSGHAIIPAGVTLGTSAGTYAAANTLSDYEEGTWTPVVDNVSGFDGSSISDISARYTKVGRQVFLEFEFRLGSSTGNISAGDDVVLTAGCLPFTPIDGGHATGTAGTQVSMGTGEDVSMGYVGFSSDFKMGIIYHTVDGTTVRNTVQGGVATYMTNS